MDKWKKQRGENWNTLWETKKEKKPYNNQMLIIEKFDRDHWSQQQQRQQNNTHKQISNGDLCTKTTNECDRYNWIAIN